MRLRTPGDLGATIRDYRLKRGWSQQELARRAGVRRQWVVAMEKGNPGASLALVLRTMNALGILLTTETAPTATKKPQGHKTVDIDQILDDLRKKKT
jgi:HTH-type transcriptional regulator / antitoxin HipB